MSDAMIRKKDIAWLRHAAFENLGGMYPGEVWERCPSAYGRLYKLGLVTTYIPHNPVHKERAVITDKGRAVLAASPSHSMERK